MASIIIKNAAKGHSKAMTALYEANKKTLYGIARYLLPEQDQAVEATAVAFREVWSGMKSAKLETPDQFTAYAIGKLVDQCKKKTLQKSPKALRVPHGKNFRLPANLLIKDNLPEEQTYLLTNLPTLHRYIFVLRTLGKMKPLQIASLLQLDPDLIEDATRAEEENFQQLQDLSKQDYTSSYAQILAAMEAPADVPAALEEACKTTIASIAAAQAQAIQKKNRTTLIVCAVAAVLVVLTVVFAILATSDSGDTDATGTTTTSDKTSGETTEDTDSTGSNIPKNSAPALVEDITYYADIDIADYGKITVKLDQSAAPATCANFVNLAQAGFYDGLTFHRIMENFMMQGGCPDGTGGGSAEENVVGEFSANGYDNKLTHTRGAISMARADDYNSASSQFFIVHKDSTFLDGDYACFGYVTEGLDVVDAVCTKAEPMDGNGTILASAQPVITSITIRTETAE